MSMKNNNYMCNCRGSYDMLNTGLRKKKCYDWWCSNVRNQRHFKQCRKFKRKGKVETEFTTANVKI